MLNEGNSLILFDTPLVTNWLTVRLLMERHPTFNQLPEWGGFQSFDFLVTISSDEECVRPTSADGPGNPLSPSTDMSAREIVHTVFRVLSTALGFIIIIILCWFILTMFDHF
jgi:hypothetical protein